MSRQSPTGMGCELMKLLRHNALTRLQIAELLGWSIRSAARWTREYEAHGLLLVERAPGAARGRRPMLYTLAPTWRSSETQP